MRWYSIRAIPYYSIRLLLNALKFSRENFSRLVDNGGHADDCAMWSLRWRGLGGQAALAQRTGGGSTTTFSLGATWSAGRAAVTMRSTSASRLRRRDQHRNTSGKAEPIGMPNDAISPRASPVPYPVCCGMPRRRVAFGR
jgi:hypothetical protein